MDNLYGIYRGVVIDNLDPLNRLRLLVHVPDVAETQSAAWAEACIAVEEACLPAVGAGVWIIYEAGIPSSPVWVGLRKTALSNAE